MTIKEAQDWGYRELAGHSPTPRLDSQVLLARALGSTRERLYIEAGREVTSDRLLLFQQYIKKRRENEPIQYITGTREFMALDFTVAPAVLIPRPETEILVETALELLAQSATQSATQSSAQGVAQSEGLRRVSAPPAIADIGTGSGAIIVSIGAMIREYGISSAKLYATDISEAALEVARGNARALGVAVTFLHGDMLEPLSAELKDKRLRLDAIVSNPPYIRTSDLPGLPAEVLREPALALDGGADGLQFYRVLASKSPGLLETGGMLAVEVGAGQADEVRTMFESNGFADCGVKKDLAGIDRVVWGFLA